MRNQSYLVMEKVERKEKTKKKRLSTKKGLIETTMEELSYPIRLAPAIS